MKRIIREMIAQRTGKKLEEVVGNTRLVEDLGLSSFDVIVLLSDLEEKLCINLDEDKIEHLDTINDILNLCISHKEENGIESSCIGYTNNPLD